MLYLVLLVAASCANVRPISGGDKDAIPPKLLSSSPRLLSTQFNSKSIMLEFDEFVQLNNIYSELIVSPPLPHQPKIKVKKKYVNVQLQDSLQSNTTYMFNFGDGITDLNESNKAQDLIYVFSTGDVIDSLSITGVVRDAFIDQGAKNYKVMLFENDTSVFAKKSIPLYFAKTKEDGSFVLQYLRAGRFFIYALDDQNSNYKWDEGEAVARLDSVVNVNMNDSIPLLLLASVPRPEKLIISDYKTDSVGAVKFPLDAFYKELKVESLNGLQVFQSQVEDTLHAWIKGRPTNRVEEVRVSWKDKLSDTLEIPFFEETQKASFQIHTGAASKLRVTDRIELHDRALMKLNDAEKIILLQDSVEQNISFSFDSLSSHFLSNAKFIAGKNYTLKILPQAFINESGGTNDTINYSFSTYKPEEMGIVEFHLSIAKDSTDCYFQLLNKNQQVVFEKGHIQAGTLRIADLPAGDYTANVLFDRNNNQIFDPVDLKSKTPPEIMRIFSGGISVRANWEVKLDWTLDEPH